MKQRHESLRDRLSRYRQITISVSGRKSGRLISVPVWFVLEGETLYLLPVRGSETQWYKNVLAKPLVRVDARGAKAELEVVAIADSRQVSPVIEKFRTKYGAGDVKKYYSNFDVAVTARVG